MRKLYYSQGSPNMDKKAMEELPDPSIYIENTGVEPLKKTIDRLMVAGMNLYDFKRGAYTAEDPDYENDEMPYMSKWTDEKDVKLRMREINRRLKNKVRAQENNPVVPEVNPETGTIVETEGK